MFAIAGGKGGCGKTTTALGVGRALAASEREPLVVDADVDMPDLHLLAGVPPEPNATDLAEGAHVRCVRHRVDPGLSIVPAGDREATAPALDRLASWPGPVLVDCPAGASRDVTTPLAASDATVLVTTDTPQSLSDARKTARMAERLDAPVVATLIRGSDAGSVPPPVDCPLVVRADGTTPADDPSCPAYRSLSHTILDGPTR